ncbi:MAG: hypothetical protein H7X97_06310 [Opitutaceae bacterium]|nr:hypothetical protein [Verrucomicrobiales bacterium]
MTFLLGILFLLGTGCRTVPPFATVDFDDKGWKVERGQAVWKPGRDSPEIAGDLTVARHRDGRTLAQFTKTPFPFVIAQTSSNGWQIEFVAFNRTLRAPGAPPRRVGWLHLAHCLDESPPPKPWTFRRLADHQFRLENASSGESVEGYLNP